MIGVMHGSRAGRPAEFAAIGPLAAIGLLLALGCQDVTLPGEPDAAPAVDATRPDARIAVDGAAPTDAQPQPERPPLTDLRAQPLVGRLPATAPVAMVLAPPVAWGERIDIPTILDATGSGEWLRAQTRGQAGHDLTDPTNWAALGLDPDRPISMAVLELDPLAVAFGARTLDAAKLRTLLYVFHAGRHPLREVQAHGATVLGRADGRGPAFGLAGDEVWVVIGRQQQRGEGFQRSLRLARGDGALAGLPEVRAALGQLTRPRDIATVINIPAIVERGLRTEAADPRIGTLREKEAFARRFDEFPRANRLMTDRLRRQAMDLFTRQREVSEQVLRSAFYPFGPAAIGARFDDDGAAVEFVQRLTPGALASTTFRAGAATTLDRLFEAPPAVRATVSFDPVVATLLARGLAIVANRGEIAAFEAELRARTGVDLRRDLVETSTGVLEIAAGADPGRFADPITLVEAMHRADVVLRWGVLDAATVRLALEHIERGLDWLEAAGEGRFVIELPPLPQIWVQVTERAVYASFDSAMLARVDVEPTGDEAPAADGGAPPADAATAADATTAADVSDAAAAAADGGAAAAAPDGGAAGGQPDGGGLAAALQVAAAVTAEAAAAQDEWMDGSEALVVDIRPDGLRAVLESLVATLGEASDGAAPADPDRRGAGRFGFERARGLAIAHGVERVRLRATQTRDAFSLRVTLAPTGDGLAQAVARIIRASLRAGPGGSPTKGGKPDRQDAP